MFFSEISFNNFLCCNLIINIKMLNKYAKKIGKIKRWWEKREMILYFDVPKETEQFMPLLLGIAQLDFICYYETRFWYYYMPKP